MKQKNQSKRKKNQKLLNQEKNIWIKNEREISKMKQQYPRETKKNRKNCIKGYTHKTSGFKTSGFKTSGFKTSEMSGLQNVRFTKRQVYKTSVLQNVRFTKRQVFKTSGCKKHSYIYSVLVVGGNPQFLLQPCLQVKWWLCFILYFRGFFAIYHHNG